MDACDNVAAGGDSGPEFLAQTFAAGVGRDEEMCLWKGFQSASDMGGVWMSGVAAVVDYCPGVHFQQKFAASGVGCHRGSVC